MNTIPVDTNEPVSVAQSSEIEEVASVSTIETPKKKNYLPWILGILGLVIVLTAFFLILNSKSKLTPTGSLIQPSASPEQTTMAATDIDTSSWKTYTNSKYGFQIKFPGDECKDEKYTSINEYIDKQGKDVFEICFKSPHGYIVQINFLNNSEGLPPFEYWKKFESALVGITTDFQCVDDRVCYEKIDGVDKNVFNIEEVKINTQVGVKIKPGKDFAGADDWQYIYIPSKQEGIMLNIYSEGYGLSDQILSTFKFINTATNKINLTLPTGWTKSVEQANNPFDETEKYERINLVKGNYRIEIGDPVGGGRANCDVEIPTPLVLNNPSLSSVVKRTNILSSSSAAALQICSNFVSKDQLDYGTKVGFIKYFLPADWDQTILKEMDSIVEFITLVK